jgi:hypothetical protein
MLTYIRRPVAAFAAAAMLHTTLAPTLALASESRVRAQAVAETVQIFDANGARNDHLTGYRPDQLASEVHAFRKLNPAILDSLRRLLVQFGTKSKRGMASVQLSLQVVDALGASTLQEFHERIQKLPIVVRRTPAEDAQGRAGTRVEYLLYGVVRATRFQPSGDQRSAQLQSNAALSVLKQATAAGVLGGPSAADDHSPLSLTEDCEYSGDEYFYGPCATQQDIDDAASAAVAMDAEAQGITNEVNQAAADNCNGPHPNEMCWESTSNDQQVTFGGPSAHESPYAASCAQKGYAFAGMGVGYIIAAAKLWGVISAVNPPASAIGYAVGAVGIALFAVVGAGVAFKDCLADAT